MHRVIKTPKRNIWRGRNAPVQPGETCYEVVDEHGKTVATFAGKWQKARARAVEAAKRLDAQI